MTQGSMPTTLDEAKTKLMLGAFGTDANDNPNPYYYNYFYNFYASENGKELSQDAIIIPTDNVAASPMKADTTIVDGYGTSISLAGRPDILIGTSSSGRGSDTDGYNTLIASIRSGAIGEEYYQEGDEDYAPYLVGYSTTTTYDMVTTLNEVANIAVEINQETGKTWRYDNPVSIAENFGDYVCGTSTYIASKIADGTIAKKTVAIVQNINSDGTFTIADAASQDATSSVRGVEYVALVSDNLASTYGTTVTAAQLLEADAIILQGSNGGGSDDTALPNSRTGLNTALETAGYTASEALADKTVIGENPDAVYGITMNSIENGIGFGYFGAYLYAGEAGLNPVYMCAYFYEKFYHISDRTALQSIVNTTFGDVTLPEGLSTDLTNYSSADIDSMLAAGKTYYYNNIDTYKDTALTKVWGTKSGDSMRR